MTSTLMTSTRRRQVRTVKMEPSLCSDGIQYVLVNGKFTVDEGERTRALPGVVLDKNEIRPRALGQQPGRTEGVHSPFPSSVCRLIITIEGTSRARPPISRSPS